MNLRALDPMIVDVHRRMPASLLRGLATHHDRGIRDALEFVGAPHMDDDHARLIFGVLNGARGSLLERATHALELARQGQHAVALPLEFARDPFSSPLDPTAFAQFAQNPPPGFGDAGGGGGGGGSSGQVRRIPWVLAGSTTLNANASGTQADPAVYTNGSPYPFVITHVTLSENLQPLNLNPSYRLKIIPVSGLQWSKERVDASALLDYMAPYGPAPTGSRVQACRWQFAAPYAQRLSQGMYVSAWNPHTTAAIQVAVGVYGVKRNQLGSPRIYWATTQLAAGAPETPLDASKFTNDGDFVCDLHAIIVSGGIGGWGAADATAPKVIVRPSEDREFTASNQGTLATAMNTQPGNMGAFWQLVNPQRIPNGSAIGIEFDETTGAQVVANVGFVGYLEVPA